MTYTLTVKASTSAALEDRPSFEQVMRILQDLEHEVATGTYIDSNGFQQVRRPCGGTGLPAPCTCGVRSDMCTFLPTQGF